MHFSVDKKKKRKMKEDNSKAKIRLFPESEEMKLSCVSMFVRPILAREIVDGAKPNGP